MYAQLNIGRNINGKPMDQKQWELFVSSAKIALAMSAIKVDHIDQNAQDKRIISLIMVHFGQGKYFNESGTLENEDSVYISLFWDQGIDFEELEKFARGLERVFEQELVAIVK